MLCDPFRVGNALWGWYQMSVTPVGVIRLCDPVGVVNAPWGWYPISNVRDPYLGY